MAGIRYEELKRTGEVDSQNFRQYTREFLVHTDDPQDGPGIVSAYVGLTLWADYYDVSGEADPAARLKGIKVEPVSGELYLWKLIASYDSRPFDQNAIANPTTGGGSLADAPTAPASPQPPGGTAPASRHWQIKWGARQTEEHVFEDINGQAAVASNSQPFEGGLAVPKAQAYFTLTCYVASPNYHKVGQYTNTCNDDMFLGFNTYTLRVSDYQITSQWEEGWGYYWQKDITFEVNNDGHDLRVLNAGTHTYSMGTGWTPIKDAFGQPVTSPGVPLDGAGQPLIPPAAPTFKTFQVYSLEDFSDIL